MVGSGDYNTFLGSNAGIYNKGGANNVFVGSNAGNTGASANANVEGNYNTFLGYQAGSAVSTQISYAGAIGANALVGCSNCLVLGGTGDYAVNVGIGTTSPYAKLSITNTGTGPSFIVEDSVSPDSSPFLIDSNGNVGIGTTSPTLKLDLHGGAMRAFNTASSTCDATTRGSTFYNETNDSFWGCKTTGWVRMDN